MQKKYFFFDIDGTLVDSGHGMSYVPESTQKAIELLRKNGHFCALATGRSHAMAEEFLEGFGFDHMVSDGGNGITLNRKLVGIEPIDKEIVCELIHECEEKGFAWALSPTNEKVRYSPTSRFRELAHDYYMETKVVEGLRPEDCDIIYKAYIACDYPQEFQLKTLDKIDWCRYADYYIFVEPCDKSVGIRKMLEILGGKIEDVVVFGDQLNDLTMFCKDWTSIAMGNAVDELKERADYVTSDVDKDGIYNACKHFGWI